MRAICLLAAVSALAAGAAPAQVVFRGGVDLVTIGVTVTDRKGVLVTDLTRDDFVVLEDRRPQRLEYFSPGDGEAAIAALRPGLLLDTSGSMEQDLRLARSAAIKFLNLLPGAPDITLVDFNSEVRVTRYPQLDFPRMVERIRGRRAGGWTALYDALGVYLDGASHQEGRPILVMYTDGADSGSSLSYGEVLDLLRASPATVYAVGLVERAGATGMDSRLRLRQMAEVTGGQAFFPRSLDELDSTYAQVLDGIRAQYQLGYTSTNQAADGRWRRVEISVRRPGLRVRARPGYFAPWRPSRR